MLEADLVLAKPELIQPYQYQTNFLAFYTQRSDDWCFTLHNGLVAEETLGGRDCWQMVGISYWDKEAGKLLAQDLKAVYETPGGRERYWELVPTTYCREHYQISIRPCEPGDVTEIDTFR